MTLDSEQQANRVLIQSGMHEATDRAIGLVPYDTVIRAMRSFADEARLAERAANGWQDIATAPASTPLMVFIPRADQPSNLPIGSHVLAYKTPHGGWRYLNGDNRGRQCGWPTHWRPLPEPPRSPPPSARPTRTTNDTDTRTAGGDPERS